MSAVALVATASRAAVQGHLASSPDLGISEGRCRAGERGPAFLVTVTGLKDRQGDIRIELYPPNDDGFLADDNVLLNSGQTFRRVVQPVPAAGPITLCIRAPAPGQYTMSVVHDRDRNHKFGLTVDGIGFPNNPPLHLSKPAAREAIALAGPGLTRLSVRMNYRRGLFSFAPLGRSG